ncbi:MAG: hypothetical protein U0Q12_18910 [Vicinamibacterales bacterium]
MHELSVPDLSGLEIDGRYILERRLRDGTRASLYAATDKRLSSPVALKLLAPSLASYPEYRERFQRQAELARQLRHPHVCQVLDFGSTSVELEGAATVTSYLCLAFMDGGSLTDRLETGEPIDLRQAASGSFASPARSNSLIAAGWCTGI